MNCRRPSLVSLLETEGIQVRVFDLESQPDRLAGQRAEIGIPFPGNGVFQSIAIHFVTIGQREAREGLSVGVLDLDPH